MTRRVRGAFATLGSAPWRRAPWLLRGRPGVLATVAGACAVLAAALAAVPLFESSVGSAAIDVQVAERCPRDTGVTLPWVNTPRAEGTPSVEPLAPLADRLGPAVRWISTPTEVTGADPADPERVVLLARDGALDHVDVLEGTPGPGLWITDRAARLTGLGVGDQAVVGGVPMDVAGVYRDLFATPLDSYWCAHGTLFESRGPDAPPLPPVVILDRETMESVQIAPRLILGGDAARAIGSAWEAPLRPDVTLSEADALVDELACTGEQWAQLEWCAEGRPALTAGAAGPAVAPNRQGDEFVTSYLESSLPFVVQRTQAIQTAVAGGVWPVAGFAALAGAGLVAAAGSLWFDRRRREVALLTVRGVAPAGLGLKAVLELGVALVTGSAAGVALAYGLVAWLGPSPTIEPRSVASAALAGAGALVAAALTVGLVVTARTRAHDRRAPRRALSAVPWELLLGAAAVVSYLRLGEWGVPVSQGAEVSTVDVVALMFPVLFLLAAVAAAMRLLTLALKPLRAASRGWATPLYLAIRRVARYRVAVTGLVAASAVAAGVLGYAATLNRSLDATLQAKARTFIGSDVAIRLAPGTEMPSELADRSTGVAVHRRAWIQADEREDVDLIAIDPETFAQAAFWDDSMAEPSLGEILERFAAPPDDRGTVPAVVVGLAVPPTAEAGHVGAGTTRFTIEPVAGVHAFPGMKRGTPTLFVPQQALDRLGVEDQTREAWFRGDRADTLAALDAAGVSYQEDRRLTDVVDRASFVTVSWTFGFMQSLGIAAGVLVVGGLAVYLDARRRGRVLGYAFARRMGLSRRQHRRALLVELAASIVVGCWLGLGIALAGAWLAYTRIDPVPGFRPDPLLRPALAVVAGLAALALVVAVLAAALAQRRTDRDDALEVLRAGA